MQRRHQDKEQNVANAQRDENSHHAAHAAPEHTNVGADTREYENCT